MKTYDIVGKPVVLKAMEGFNGTVFTCKKVFLILISFLCNQLYFRRPNGICKTTMNEL